MRRKKEEKSELKADIEDATYEIRRLDQEIDLSGPLVDLVVQKRVEEYRVENLWQSMGDLMSFNKVLIDFNDNTVCVDFEPE